MILRVTDKTGDTMVDTAVDGAELARELFAKAKERGMWGKGIKDGVSEFVQADTEFNDILQYDEVIMLARQVGG